MSDKEITNTIAFLEKRVTELERKVNVLTTLVRPAQSRKSFKDNIPSQSMEENVKQLLTYKGNYIGWQNETNKILFGDTLFMM